MTTTTEETEVQALRRELREMQERLASANGGGADDSITVARREIEAQYFSTVPSIMDAPCAHIDADGNACRLSWKVDNDTIRAVHRVPGMGTHSYRPKPLESPEFPAGNAYHLGSSDRAQYGLEEPPPKAAQDVYMSEKQASGRLQVTLKALRGMVKDGTVEADKIGDVSLVRRQSVERILAMAEAIKDAGDEEAESDG